MGTIVAMAYPTKMLAKQADHTYVKCANGGTAWGCWGGKTGGRSLGQGTASTKRADKIAGDDGKAGIKCYLVNGVCHQAANRILLPAHITVRDARGYSVSEAMFGTYGRVGIWPCKSPFNQHPSVTGDLPSCRVPRTAARKPRLAASRPLMNRSKLDWHYTEGVLKIYKDARKLMRAKTFARTDAKSFHLELFMYMAEFHLGAMLDRTLARKLKQVRNQIERERVKSETAFANDQSAAREFVDAFNKTTILFQDEMANVMKAEQYHRLFDLDPGDNVILADRKILKKQFGLKY